MAAPLLDDEWAALFESGSAHIVGVLAADGTPFATRGWGVRFSSDRSEARVLLGATEAASLGHVDDGKPDSVLALTCSTIRTLRSAQVKGPIRSLESVTTEDLAAHERYCGEYFDAVLEVDMISRRLMERMVPAELVACTFAIVEAYDQTPGPGAGRPLGTAAP